MDEQNKSKKSPIIWIIVVIVLIGVAAGVYFFMSGNEETNTNTANTASTSTTTNTAATNTNTAAEADPYADLMKYDDKVVTITSADGKVTGQMAISINKSEQMPITVTYFMKVADSLPKSIAEASGSGEAYYYIASHAVGADIRAKDGTGSLSEAFCNTDQMADVLAMAQARNINLELYRGCDAQYDPWHTTDTFYHLYNAFYNNYTFDYDELVAKDTLAIFDSAPFYEADEEIGGWGADDETVVQQGDIFAQYSLIYTE